MRPTRAGCTAIEAELDSLDEWMRGTNQAAQARSIVGDKVVGGLAGVALLPRVYSIAIE